MENQITKNESQLLRINEVVELTTLSKSCIHLWVAQGRFPPPTSLSSTVKVWRLKHLAQWIEDQTSSCLNSETSSEQSC